jgi:hypothetical protein
MVCLYRGDAATAGQEAVRPITYDRPTQGGLPSSIRPSGIITSRDRQGRIPLCPIIDQDIAQQPAAPTAPPLFTAQLYNSKPGLSLASTIL